MSGAGPSLKGLTLESEAAPQIGMSSHLMTPSVASIVMTAMATAITAA